jgi:hypothetical protein
MRMLPVIQLHALNEDVLVRAERTPLFAMVTLRLTGSA